MTCVTYGSSPRPGRRETNHSTGHKPLHRSQTTPQVTNHSTGHMCLEARDKPLHRSHESGGERQTTPQVTCVLGGERQSF
ncbi:hypothetical protein DPMN_097527 [Dreissena polymorpha]|uniref:Uncharacterized protein n=1 Tax=Dreissena polymorpha TaxID=45954 RepID=A0A9D4R5H3_DREPO|nr:hypothetical protein DPMN_097527 [Dreissena polymorpha]